MAYQNPPFAFRESFSIVDATNVVEVPLFAIASGGASMTMNSSAVPMTIAGALTFSGLLTYSGGVKVVVTSDTSASHTVAAADSGTVYIAAKTSATQTYTLPSAATAGLRYVFLAASAAGEILVNPASGQTISIKATVDQGASVVTASSTGIKNTAATNVVGDLIELVSDGGTNWWMLRQSGIWASQ